jgi:hypothetical protein
MPPKAALKVGKKPAKGEKKKGKKQQEELAASENMDQDDDLLNLDQNANQGFD